MSTDRTDALKGTSDVCTDVDAFLACVGVLAQVNCLSIQYIDPDPE